MFIYLIVNHVTGKYYVGQHKGNSLKQYLQQKLYEANKRLKARSHLYASMRKHGREAFSIHALLSDIQTKEELDQKEKEFIEFLRSRDPEYGYNICKGGEGFTGPHTAEWKQTRSKLLKSRGHKPPADATALSIQVRNQTYQQTGIWPGVRRKDMAGEVINGVTVLSQLPSTPAGDAIWLCRCPCGTEFSALGGSLRSGHTRSCGCLKNEQDRNNLSKGDKIKDMTGAVVNGIEVISRASNIVRTARDGRTRTAVAWLCRCTCGNTFVTKGYHLRSGHTKSCGCLNPIRNRKTRLSKSL